MTEKPEPIDVFVGQRLRSFRQEAWLTQTQLGEAIGVSFQQIQKYEKGTNRISSSRLWDICLSLDKTPPEFFPDSEVEVASSDHLHLAHEIDSKLDAWITMVFLTLARQINRSKNAVHRSDQHTDDTCPADETLSPWGDDTQVSIREDLLRGRD